MIERGSADRPVQQRARPQLILKSKAVCGVGVQWLVLRGPYGEARLAPAVRAHAFADDSADSPAHPLPLADRGDTNRLLSNKAIHFRYADVCERGRGSGSQGFTF